MYQSKFAGKVVPLLDENWRSDEFAGVHRSISLPRQLTHQE